MGERRAGANLTTVLVSELGAISSQRGYLPYIWGILRSHLEHELPEVAARVDWLAPLHGPRPPEQALASVDARRIDVLGLSCYTWNWDPQRALARAVKAAHPDCLVVAGGPQPDVASSDFFVCNPEIDAVVINDGEIPFGRIVERVSMGDRYIADIPGVVVPGPDARPHMAHAPIKPTGFFHSPYLEYADTYERILHDLPGTSIVLETNRGCPYKCSFCDWGSNTMSKIRPFDLERVRAEAHWVFRQPIFMVMLADANFGILPRDVEIAELYATLRRRDTGPQFFYYSPAKNNPRRTTEIAKIFSRAGLAANHAVAVQHTDPEVLAATDRANISIEKQREVVRELSRSGVALSAQLILGIPGDTVDKWEQVFADLMEWGVHDCWVVSDYALLPNAPAASPEFRARWRYETVRRPAVTHGRSRPKGTQRGVCSIDFIVACRTFTGEDWIQMRAYSAFVCGLHNTGFTRRIAQYLRFCHGVSYRRFYGEVIHDLVRARLYGGAWWRTLIDNLRAFSSDPRASDTLDCELLPTLGLDLRHDDWVLLQVGLHANEFFEQLGQLLARNHPQASALASVVAYQRQLVITDDYEATKGRRFESAHEWSDLFRDIDRLVQYEPRPEPALAPADTVYAIEDTATGQHKQLPLDWGDIRDPDARRLAWARSMLRLERASASHCFDLPRRVPRAPRAPVIQLRTPAAARSR